MSLIPQQLPMFPKEDLPVELSQVRAVWGDDDWLFSVVDFIAVMTNTKQHPRQYWHDLKERLSREIQDVSEIFRQLKLEGTDGKMYETDVASREGLLRIVQSMPSNKVTSTDSVERVKRWLARKGAQAIEDEINPDRAVARFEGKIARQELMQALRDVVNPPQWVYGAATNDVYKGVFHRDHKALCRELNTKSPRDKMDTIALSYLRIAETICSRHIGERQELSIIEARIILQDVSGMIGVQVDDVERRLGIDVVTGHRLLGPSDAIKGA